MIKTIDKLLGVEVRLFTRPHYEYDEKYDSETLDFDCGDEDGNSVSYSIGDKVPYKTMWYNYGKNFLVVTPARQVGEKNFVCAVTNGKANDVICYDTSHPEYYEYYYNFTLDLRVFDDYGKPMNIHSDEDLYYFFLNYEECNAQLAELRRSFHTIEKPLHKFSKFINDDEINLAGTLSNNIHEALIAADEWFTDGMSRIFSLIKPYYDEEAGYRDSDYGIYGVYLYEIMKRSFGSEKTFADALTDILSICGKAYNHIGGRNLTLEEYLKWNQTKFGEKEMIILVDSIIRGVANAVTL